VHADPESVGILLPRVGEHARELHRERVVAGERFADAVQHAQSIGVGVEVWHHLLRLRLEDLGELAALAKARHAARIGRKAGGRLPLDRDPGTSP